MNKPVGFPVQFVQSAGGADPNFGIAGLDDGVNEAFAQTIGIADIVFKMTKLIGLSIKKIQPAVCADPYIFVRILINNPGVIVAEPAVFRIVNDRRLVFGIKICQSAIKSRKPQTGIVIFKNIQHPIAAQTMIFHGIADKSLGSRVKLV